LAALGYTHLKRHGEAIGAEAALAPAISRLVCRSAQVDSELTIARK